MVKQKGQLLIVDLGEINKILVQELTLADIYDKLRFLDGRPSGIDDLIGDNFTELNKTLYENDERRKARLHVITAHGKSIDKPQAIAYTFTDLMEVEKNYRNQLGYIRYEKNYKDCVIYCGGRELQRNLGLYQKPFLKEPYISRVVRPFDLVKQHSLPI